MASEQISLRAVVDEENNRVLYAEAEKGFVDILLSFLTLSPGTNARLLRKDSNMKPCRLGCISSLQAWDISKRCSSQGTQWNVTIKNSKSTLMTLSISKNMKCKCGRDLTFVVKPCKSLLRSPLVSGSDKNASGDTGVQNANDKWEGYAKGSATFNISDDFSATPANLSTNLCLLKNLRSRDPPNESTMVLG